MRPDIERWFLQGKEELDTAKVDFNAGKWFAAAFWTQQAVEKVLKALYLFTKKESPGTTHSLTFLGRELGVPQEFLRLLRDSTKDYYLSRYPDASEDVPFLMYRKEDVEQGLSTAEDLLQWVEKQLKK